MLFAVIFYCIIFYCTAYFITKYPRLSKPKGDSSKEPKLHQIGWRKKPWENPCSVGASSPLAYIHIVLIEALQ